MVSAPLLALRYIDIGLKIACGSLGRFPAIVKLVHAVLAAAFAVPAVGSYPKGCYPSRAGLIPGN
jgi:hypothetical protein